MDRNETTRTPLERVFADDQDDDEMPEEELDEPKTVGGGIMSQGGTAIDRGTGTLTGQAQGVDDDDDDDDDRAGVDVDFGADAADRVLGHDD
jgi:hypothetical protein